jgi:transcriptional regulator with XRE-family HTH domain
MSIGTRIIQIRGEQNISQRQLSERSGLASSYLSRIENRRIEPRPKTLRKIADALGVPMSDLFQESPAAHRLAQCAITLSGDCIMEKLQSRAHKADLPGTETYTPRQLQLLRMANYLIQTANQRVLDSFELLLSGLMASGGSGGDLKKPDVALPRTIRTTEQGG